MRLLYKLELTYRTSAPTVRRSPTMTLWWHHNLWYKNIRLGRTCLRAIMKGKTLPSTCQHRMKTKSSSAYSNTWRHIHPPQQVQNEKVLTLYIRILDQDFLNSFMGHRNVTKKGHRSRTPAPRLNVLFKNIPWSKWPDSWVTTQNLK